MTTPTTPTPATTAKSTAPAYFKVHLTESLGGGARNHIALFVANGPTPSSSSSSSSSPAARPASLSSGTIYNTTGTILQSSGGQVYEVRPSINPQRTPEHIPGTFRCIGRILVGDLRKFEEICERMEVPGPQVDLRGRVVVPGRRVRRCTEWVEEVVEKLRGEGVLVGEEGEGGDGGSS